MKTPVAAHNVKLHTSADKIIGGRSTFIGKVIGVKLVVLLIAVGLGPKVAVNVRDLRATYLLPPRPNRDGLTRSAAPCDISADPLHVHRDQPIRQLVHRTDTGHP